MFKRGSVELIWAAPLTCWVICTNLPKRFESISSELGPEIQEGSETGWKYPEETQ